MASGCLVVQFKITGMRFPCGGSAGTSTDADFRLRRDVTGWKGTGSSSSRTLINEDATFITWSLRLSSFVLATFNCSLISSLWDWPFGSANRRIPLKCESSRRRLSFLVVNTFISCFGDLHVFLYPSSSSSNRSIIVLNLVFSFDSRSISSLDATSCDSNDITLVNSLDISLWSCTRDSGLLSRRADASISDRLRSASDNRSGECNEESATLMLPSWLFSVITDWADAALSSPLSSKWSVEVISPCLVFWFILHLRAGILRFRTIFFSARTILFDLVGRDRWGGSEGWAGSASITVGSLGFDWSFTWGRGLVGCDWPPGTELSLSWTKGIQRKPLMDFWIIVAFCWAHLILDCHGWGRSGA